MGREKTHVTATMQVLSIVAAFQRRYVLMSRLRN